MSHSSGDRIQQYIFRFPPHQTIRVAMTPDKVFFRIFKAPVTTMWLLLVSC